MGRSVDFLESHGQSPLAWDAGSLQILPHKTPTPTEGPPVYFNGQGLQRAGM